MNLKKIALFTADPWESALTNIRVKRPAHFSGVEVVQGNQSDQVYLGKITAADIIVIQRDFPRFPNYDAVIEKARRENKRVVYEVDDLILEVPEWHVSYPAYIDVLFKILKAVAEADMVVTSTPLLQEYFLDFNPNTCTVFNYLDDEFWPIKAPRSPENGRPVVIGYMGGGSHRPDLEMIEPVLLSLSRKYEGNLHFQFYGVTPPEKIQQMPNSATFAMDVCSYQEFANRFSEVECDIFIAPLQNIYFNRFKSHIKFLEYCAMGIPGVYSCVDPYTSVINHGKNGLLANTLDDWETCLVQLIEDPHLRFELSQNAQETLLENWLLSKNHPKWLSAYQEAMHSKPLPVIDRDENFSKILRIAKQSQMRHDELLRQISWFSQENQQLKMILDSRLWKAVQKLRLVYRSMHEKLK